LPPDFLLTLPSRLVPSESVSPGLSDFLLVEGFALRRFSSKSFLPSLLQSIFFVAFLPALWVRVLVLLIHVRCDGLAVLVPSRFRVRREYRNSALILLPSIHRSGIPPVGRIGSFPVPVSASEDARGSFNLRA